MKYKIGDKVRIVSEWKSMDNVNCAGRMDKWLGKTMTIISIVENRYYKMKEDEHDKDCFLGDGWCWFDCHIEGLTTSFTKADLQTGDVCKQRNGVVQIYMKDLSMFITTDGWNKAESFHDDLTHIYGDEYDIVAVRRPTKQHHCQFSAFDSKLGDLVYERVEPEEMTLEEVCRLLGKEIKIVKNK